MDRQEVMLSKVGEMLDMISCLSVYNGTAELKDDKKLSYDEAISLR